MRRRRYAVLLTLLCVALAIDSINARGVAALLSDTIRTALGVAIWFVVFKRPRERIAMAAVLVAATVFSWGRYFAAGSLGYTLSLMEQATLALFLWVAVYVILRELFDTSALGAGHVLGSICGYIIAGDAWARLNAVAYLLVPSAYSIDPAVTALLPDWHGRVALFTYYAYAQLLTLGYSDVTPAAAPATTLSLFAALFGVFYTAVVISQFVGLAQAAKRGGRNE
jgi:voltage-gated potassium channel Kch